MAALAAGMMYNVQVLEIKSSPNISLIKLGSIAMAQNENSGGNNWWDALGDFAERCLQTFDEFCRAVGDVGNLTGIEVSTTWTDEYGVTHTETDPCDGRPEICWP